MDGFDSVKSVNRLASYVYMYVIKGIEGAVGTPYGVGNLVKVRRKYYSVWYR
jgi:hypothetical protein